MFVVPTLSLHFVFHATREAFMPQEEKDNNGKMVISSVKWKFCCSVSMIKWVINTFDSYNTSSIVRYVVKAGCLDVVK